MNKTFDVTLHAGTLLAVLAHSWRDALRLLAAFFRSLARRRADSSEEKLASLRLLSTISGAAAGAALEGFVESQLRKPYLVAIFMILFGLVL